MTTMEMSTSSNGTTIPTTEPLSDTVPLTALPSSSKSVPDNETSYLNGNSEISNSTVCYLANGAGHIDRLNLVLPLTSSSTVVSCPLPALPTEKPFPSQLVFEPALTNPNFCSENDRTPVNSEKDFAFSPSSIRQSSSFSSCRTVDSGTESICSDGVEEYMTDLAADRILKFFASDSSKSNRFSGRRPTSGNIRQTSTEDDEEDIYSDESTLSESSVSPQDFASNPVMITPELVVAAIDAKIKQRETRKTLDTTDKNTEGACDTTNNADTECGRVQSPGSPIEADIAIPISELKLDDNDWAATDSTNKIRYMLEVEDDLDYDCDDDDEDCPPVRLTRSTSLKTGKTPPGTPRGKKIVRFADALGLDLESVRHIVDDGPYMPPLAAFKGLKLDDEDKQWLFGQRNQSSSLQPLPTSSLPPTVLTSKPNLRVLFCQPSSDPGPFLERIRSHKVCLENSMVTGPSGPSDMFTITCIIRVLNIGFEKSVTLRYTTNEWLTYTDVLASWFQSDGFSDKFTVTFHVAVNSNGHQTMLPGQRLLFALKYLSNSNQEYWDNNMGMNYALIYQRS